MNIWITYMDPQFLLGIIQRKLFMPEYLILGMFSFLVISNGFILSQSEIGPTSKAQPIIHSTNPLETAEISFKLKEHLKFQTPERFFLDDYHSKGNVLSITSEGVNTNEKITTDLGKSISQQVVNNLIILSFYIGYAISHIVGVLMIKRDENKSFLEISLAFIAFVVGISPIVRVYVGPSGLIFIRFLLGLTEGPIFPAFGCLLNQRYALEGNESHAVAAIMIILRQSHLAMLWVSLLSLILMPYFQWLWFSYTLRIFAFLWFLSFIVILKEKNSIPESQSSIKFLSPISTNSLIGLTSSDTHTWREMLSRPSKTSLISSTLQNTWSQLLIMNKLQNLMIRLREPTLTNTIWSNLQMGLPLIGSWTCLIFLQAIVTIYQTQRILTEREATKLKSFLSIFLPQICADFANCLLSSDNTISTEIVCNCVMSVMRSYYVDINISSVMDNESNTLRTLVIELGSLTNIIIPYVEHLTEEIRPRINNVDPNGIQYTTNTPNGDI
ncbi:uncharacterized protein LOC142226928 [Haematobia irritans]|uniref:uncharacterized protein LOC142226928 n=1 Tax=Haematobia irritans TaxID=7368 RepID=UPI003F4F731E